MELHHQQHMLPKHDDIIPPIVINSTFRSGQSNSVLMPLHRNSIQHGAVYGGKNAIVNAQYPISTYGTKQTRIDQHTNRVVLRNGVYEQSGLNDRAYTSISSKNNVPSSTRPGYSPKGLAFAPGFYCRKVEKEHQSSSAPPPKFNNSFPKSSTGNIKYHVDKDKPTPGAQQFTTGIVGTVLTGNGQSKLTYYQARDVTLDWPLHSNYKQQRRVCSALASKRKVPSVIS